MGLNNSAVGLIDQGFINAIKQLGHECLIWDADAEPKRISNILESFAPTHFIGYLQNAYRNNTVWTNKDILSILCEYKKKHRLYVAVDSVPSNIKDLFQEFLPDIGLHTQEGVSSYYLQDERPNPCEQKVFDSGLIDIISSRFSAECFPIAYKNFLEMGITVVEMPPAADTTLFCKDKDLDFGDQNIDLLYIGGCWSFKWENMRDYILLLKERFGRRFKIFGRGWPDGISEGELGNGVSDNRLLIEYTKKAKINLAFHEPSQVLSFATSGNERVYKLLALGSCVLTDPCATFNRYFIDNRDLVIAKNATEMVLKAEKLLDNTEKRIALASSGRQTILAEHTYTARLERLLNIYHASSNKIITYKDYYE